MTSELKQRIRELEDERDSVSAFIEEVDREVASGALTQELASEIIQREYVGRSPGEIIRALNEQITNNRTLLASTPSGHSKLRAAVPLVLILTLVAVVAINFGAITGFFTFGQDETFYAIPLEQTYASSISVPLAITDPLSSFRLDGTAQGTGSARAYLKLGNARLLIASYDGAQPNPSPLTGRVTGDASDELFNTPTEDEQATADGNTDNIDAEVVELPSTPQIDEQTTIDNRPGRRAREVTYENSCIETCSLPGISAETSLEIEITGDVEFAVNRLLFGTRGEPLAQDDPEVPSEPQVPLEPEQPPIEEAPTIPVTNGTNSSNNATNVTGNATIPVIDEPSVPIPVVPTPVQPVPVVPAPSNGTPVNGTPVNVTPVNVTPVVPVEPVATVGVGITGTVCAADADCASGACVQSRYRGAVTGSVCVDNRVSCVAGTVAFAPGAESEDSVCIAGERSAVWLVRSGQGRFIVEAANGVAAAAIDKYGTMVVTGPATFGVAPGTTGWLVKDATGTVAVSIDEQGALLSLGRLVTQTAPQRTSSGDFVVRAASGSDAAIITQAGDVLLAGSFLSGATLQ